MVNKLKSIIRLFVIGSLTVSSVQAATTTFSAMPSTSKLELGKALNLVLSTSNKNASFDKLDLSPLAQDFVIKEIGDAVLDNKTGLTTITIRLYPRAMGDKRIPALSLAGVSSAAVPVTVTPAIDPKTKEVITLAFEYTRQPLWVKQQWLMKARLLSGEKFIVLDTEEIKIRNFSIYPLDKSRKISDKPDVFRHELGWAMFSTRAGEYDIQLPAIRYYRDGVNTHRFYPPTVSLKIQLLPSYVPGTIPVGKLRLIDNESKKLLHVVNQLYERRFQLVADGIVLSDLPDMQMLTTDTDNVVYYPASEDQQQNTSETGIVSRITYTVPFVTQQSGLIKLPLTRLQYFDPDTGKIQSVSPLATTRLTLNLWLMAFLIICGSIILLWASNVLFRRVKTYWQVVAAYYSALELIGRADRCTGFKQAMQTIAQAEGWPTNTTLLQWQQNWTTQFPRLRAHVTCINTVMQGLYRGDQVDIEIIRSGLKSLCGARLPVLGFLYRYKNLVS